MGSWLPGLAIMLVTETATLAGVEPFQSWNTPIAWTGFILFADGLVYRGRGDSWLRSNPRELACLALVSIPLWLVFEAYNLVIRNWHYVGLPANWWLRQWGYAWSFATIWPAIFEGAELMGLLRVGTARPAPARPALPALSYVAVGALMLAMPYFVSPDVARYLAAPVWLGFIFLLDPINARLGEPSLIAEIRQHRHDRVINLMLSGLLCGVLWEFWNYWARAKWHHTVPVMERFKIFEMPLPGYLGFPFFALECFTMYAFVRGVWARLSSGVRPGRAIGL